MKYFAILALSLPLVAAATVAPADAQPRLAEAKRPRIVITPRNWDVEPPPTAKRYCTSRLVKQDRPSGQVIVPVTNCWWQE